MAVGCGALGGKWFGAGGKLNPQAKSGVARAENKSAGGKWCGTGGKLNPRAKSGVARAGK